MKILLQNKNIVLANNSLISINSDNITENGNLVRITIPETPKKGSIINMNLDGTERQYRVLNVNGNVCKVLGMFDDLTSKYNSTSMTTTFGSTTAQKYGGSTLDTYLNTT